MELAWWILFLPLAAFLIISLVTWPYKKLSGLVTVSAIGASAVLAIIQLARVIATPGVYESSVKWLTVGPVKIEFGVLVDPLSAAMAFVVSFVSFFIQVYSTAYMEHDPGYSRYFAFMGLFTFSMLGIVFANNFLMVYIFWELVGLCSYLLIGFWYFKPAAAAAAKKAFVVTRFGDFGFLLGILMLFYYVGAFNYGAVSHAIEAGQLSGLALTIAAVLVFCGAIGKSAQFPLHVWLPDAMEGPTPVSALIHAATMVAAGVYLVARVYDLYHVSEQAMLVVAYIGGITAFLAASMAIAQSRMKRIIAYSTCSHLAYMMMALGVGGFTAGTFHLMVHAFFKALLFLCAGSVMLLYFHEENIWRMGGLYRFMKVTAVTMIIAGLSNAGLFPFAGFFSKDEILVAAKESGHMGLYWLGTIIAFMTAFYTFRLIFVVFFGPRSEWSPVSHGHDHDHHEELPDIGNPRPSQVWKMEPVDPVAREESDRHLRREPWTVTVPLTVLSLFAIFAGFLAWPGIEHGFASFVYYKHPHHAAGFDVPTLVISNLMVLAGIGAAWAIYGRRKTAADPLSEMLGPIYRLFERKYYFDEIYLWFIRRFVDGGAAVLAWFEENIFTGVLANGIGAFFMDLGRSLRLFQNGWVQRYALIFFLGVLVIVAVLVLGEPGVSAAIGGGIR
ncbi:NADH-quinone oxidoreductase subunit L [Thermodesulfitimonas autotrophica]|uniref:NADH-quinone oxidoreductase subunit L n=1 Tax=Thermodesulfitimonas autotrophica TaxID=1894989 RepID=UPI002FE20F74